ncbi:MAG: right-handed parallel beta-helix repeat-containing protein, partial [Candidatus Omnitrophica bacterium]|nr:right-handed parallel beta-helix repeat-containing protein [Candidatus Omnitrophota bacterium]
KILPYIKKFAYLLVISCIVLCSTSFAYGSTIYIPGKYSTIQEGINAASAGDTIIVSTGIYEETATVKDDITLIGLGLPTIGSPSSGGLSAGNNCMIDGFKIHALNISAKSNVTVKNCVLFGRTNQLTSTSITGSQNIYIESNTFSDEYYGGVMGSRIGVTNVQGLTFKNNIVLMKNMAEPAANITALYLDTVSNASILNNVITAESVNTGIGIFLATMGSTIIKDNIISGTTYSVYGNSANVIISYNDLPEGISHVGPDITLGPNNFSCEPVFAEGRGYYLKASSPCVDAGIIEESEKTEIGAHQKITYLTSAESLQAAIDNAIPNETIYLAAGTYNVSPYITKNENGTTDLTSYGILIIRKDVHIVGSGKHNTFVKGPIEFIFSNGSLENLTVVSPNSQDTDYIAEIDYDLDGRREYGFTGSVLIANGSPRIENVMLEPDLTVLGDPPAVPPTGIAIIESTSGSPTSPIIRNVSLKKYADAIKIEGANDELALSPLIEHCVFDQNTRGINCDTPYALLAVRNSIFSNMTNAIDLTATPYKQMITDNIQSNLFYNNTNNCIYNGSETINILANNRNNQTGDPGYLRPDINLYATLFDSPAMAINAGLEHYSEKGDSDTVKYYESANKGYLLAETTSPDQNGDFTQTVKIYNGSGTYTGKTVRHFVGTMAELFYYDEYDAADTLTGSYYADGTSYPDNVPGTNNPTVVLSSPSGSVLLKAVVPVMWTAADPDGDPLSIDIYYSTNGVDFNILALGLENDGVYEWESASCPDSSSYKIRVVAYKTNNETTSSQDESDVVFELDNTLPAISITSPADNTGADTETIIVTGTVSDANLDIVEVKVSGYSDWQLANLNGGAFSCSVNIPAGGTRAIIVAMATDTAGNISTDKVGIIKGYMRYIKLPKYYMRDENLMSMSSIAASQDLIHLMQSTDYGYSGMPNEADLYSYGLSRNYSGHQSSGSEFDAQGLCAALQYYDPYGADTYVGYNFGITAVSDFNTYLKDIVHWLSWAIKKPGVTTPRGTPEQYPDDYCRAPYMAAVAPLSAYIQGYSRWVVINGCASDASPVSTTQPWKSNIVQNVTVYGLFMTDPQTRGIGEDIYVPAASLSDYLQPLGPGISDPYTDKYVAVVEPPPGGNFAVEPAGPVINKSTLTLLNIAKFVNGDAADDFSRHLVDGALVVELDESKAVKNFSTGADLITLFRPEILDDENNSSINWKDVIPSAQLLDEDFKNAVEGSEVREFIKVHRNDTAEDYYIIPFDKYVNNQYLSQAAMLVDASTSCIITTSYVKEPVRYIQLTKEEAIAQIVKSKPELRNKDIEARFVWEPGKVTESPFYPYWEVTAEGKNYYIWEE